MFMPCNCFYCFIWCMWNKLTFNCCVGTCLFKNDSNCSEIFGFPCQYHSFIGLYSYFIYLGSTLCNLSSDSIIKYSFVSYSLLRAVNFFIVYLHSIHVPLNYYFLLVGIVIRLWTGQPRNEGSISSRCKIFCSSPWSPVVMPTQPPLQWVSGARFWGTEWLEFEADHLRLVPRVRMYGALLHLLHMSSLRGV
jgi:hypothetical protein